MANEQKITEIWDIGALEAQRDKVIALMKQTVSEMEKTNSVKISFNGDAKTIGDATKITSEYNKQYENTIRLTGQLNNLKSTEGQIEEKLQQAQKETIKNKKLEIQATNEQVGAYTKLSAEAALATKNAREMAAQYGTSSKEFKQASQTANELNTKLKEIDAEINIHSKNVGNYEGATMSLRQEIRKLTQTLAGMEMQGQNNSKEYKTMVMRLGELKDAVGDVQARSKFFADDARYLNTVTQAVQGVVGAYSVWVGASELLGTKNEELEKIMRKMMALMTIMQGLSQVQKMLDKDSYVRVAASLIVDKAKVWWTELQTAATIKGTIAQRALNVAMKMNPIGLVIAAIMALVTAMGFYLNSLKKEREQQDINNGLSKAQREELKKRGEAYKKAVTDIDGYIKKLEDQGKTELELILQSIELRRQQDLLIAKGSGAIANEAILVENLTKKQEELQKQIDSVDITTTAGLETQKKLQIQYDAITQELIPLNEKLKNNKNLSKDLTTIINENADAEIKYVIALSKKTVGTEKQVEATKDLHKEIEDLYNLLDKSIKQKTPKYLDLQPTLQEQFEHIKEFNALVLENTASSEAEKTAALLSNEDIRYAEELLKLADNQKAQEEAEKIHIQNINAIRSGIDPIKPPEEGKDGSPYDWKDYFNEIAKGANDTLSGVTDIMDLLMQKELSTFQDVQDGKLRVLNERLRLGLISEEQYMADKSDLELEYDKKKKELEKEQFKRTKAMAYAEAVIQGAMASVQALNAKTLAMGIIQLAFVGTALALQLAKIQAQTPGYAKGRKDGPGETAYVGEQGWEYRGNSTGIFKTPNTKTLTYLQPHEWVMPHNESVKFENILQAPKISGIKEKKETENRELLNAINKLNSKPNTSINIDKHGFAVMMAKGGSYVNFVNDHIRIKH